MEEKQQPKKDQQPLMIKEFSKHRIEFSNGAVITCESGEFDYDVIRAILKAGE